MKKTPKHVAAFTASAALLILAGSASANTTIVTIGQTNVAPLHANISGNDSSAHVDDRDHNVASPEAHTEQTQTLNDNDTLSSRNRLSDPDDNDVTAEGHEDGHDGHDGRRLRQLSFDSNKEDGVGGATLDDDDELKVDSDDDELKNEHDPKQEGKSIAVGLVLDKDENKAVSFAPNTIIQKAGDQKNVLGKIVIVPTETNASGHARVINSTGVYGKSVVFGVNQGQIYKDSFNQKTFNLKFVKDSYNTKDIDITKDSYNKKEINFNLTKDSHNTETEVQEPRRCTRGC